MCFAGTTHLLTPAHKKQFLDIARLLREVYMAVRLPIEKLTGASAFHDTIVECQTKLLAFAREYSASDCNQPKIHGPLHWAQDRRDLGVNGLEYSFEKKLGEDFKKLFYRTSATQAAAKKITNVDGTLVTTTVAALTKNDQMAGRVYHMQRINDLVQHSARMTKKQSVIPSGKGLKAQDFSTHLKGDPVLVHQTDPDVGKHPFETTNIQKQIHRLLVKNTNGMAFPARASSSLRLPLRDRGRDAVDGSADHFDVATILRASKVSRTRTIPYSTNILQTHAPYSTHTTNTCTVLHPKLQTHAPYSPFWLREGGGGVLLL